MNNLFREFLKLCHERRCRDNDYYDCFIFNVDELRDLFLLKFQEAVDVYSSVQIDLKQEELQGIRDCLSDSISLWHIEYSITDMFKILDEACARLSNLARISSSMSGISKKQLISLSNQVAVLINESKVLISKRCANNSFDLNYKTNREFLKEILYG